MEFIPLKLEGLMLVKPRVFEDERGFFFESYRSEPFEKAGLGTQWLQDNHSVSRKGVVRGLHFAKGEGQAKLIRCARGSIFDVAVDIRPDSPTLGQWEGVELSESNHAMLYIPVGFAHGYAALTDPAVCLYKCSEVYRPDVESEIAWNDPDIAVEWPIPDPDVSERDRKAPRLREYLASLGKTWPDPSVS